MANLNVNIAKKLISYVRHGVDINDDIKEIYNNSLIFIGDESQIFVPAMNTYVGIGNTAYNQTIDRIDAIEDEINELRDTLAKDLVTKIYANYSLDEMLGNNATPIKSDNTQRPSQIGENGRDLWALNNEITLKGIGDYDPSTGFSRTVSNPYILDLPAESGLGSTTVTNSALYRKDGKALASSGITITPHWGELRSFENEATGQVIWKRFGNYIEIDDKLTWSYMTSAYSYSMNFAKKYTASEVDRLYHNLLGDYRATYLASNFEEIAVDESAFINELSADEYTNYVTSHVVADYEDEGNHTYYVIDTTRTHDVGDVTYSGVFVGSYLTSASYTTTENPEEVVRTDNVTYRELTLTELQDLLSSGDASGLQRQDYTLINYTSQKGVFATFPQLYTLDAQYDSTYNMNIADGINTLKEVAYLLDKLSDGSLGTTTYFTYAQVSEAGVLSAFDSVNGYYTYTVDQDHVYKINWNTKQVTIDNAGELVKWNSPKPDDIVGWYVIEGDQDNLGIQIAYSIAGNKIQIDDLHTHAELLEKGETTLRSIQSTSSDFVTIDLVGGTYHWTNTDTNQGESDNPAEPYSNEHPNWNSINPGNIRKEATTYLVGDVNIKAKLNTAKVYATTYTADVTASSGTPVNSKFEDEFGVVWYGTYTAADMNALVSIPVGTNLTSDTTYYIIDTDNTIDSNAPVFKLAGINEDGRLSEEDIDSRLQSSDQQYYWIPGGSDAKNDGEQNVIYVKVSRDEINAMGNSDILPSQYSPALYKSTAIFYVYDENQQKYVKAVQNADSTWSDVVSSALLNDVDTFYYIAGYDETKIHAVTGENKVATTEWTGAFVDDKVGEIVEDLEDILEEAKQYTDQEIDKLDNNYIYTDFASYWSYFQNSIASEQDLDELTVDGVNYTFIDLRTPGTSAFITTYNKFYEDYCDGTITDRNTVYPSSYEGTNPYRLSYISNSEYLYNVVEEDGIVTGEGRELPTDTLKTNVEVWGSDANVAYAYKHHYAPVTLSHERGDALFDALYNWVAVNDDNQIFVSLFDANTTYSFVPLDPAVVGNVQVATTLALENRLNKVGGTDDGLYEWYNNGYAQVSLTTDRRGVGFDSSNYLYTNTNDKFWFRLYQKGPVYYELNLQDAEAVYNNNVLNTDSITIGNYTLTRASSQINVSGPGIGNGTTDTTTLLYISSKADETVKYLTVENKHFSYVNNGSGQNEFNVTAHITRIEDATATNTGFADAFDVQSYVENYFKWVNISASVSEYRVSHSDDYYAMITLEEYRRISAAVAAGQNLTTAQRKALPKYVQFDQNDNAILPTLYKRNDVSGTVTSGAETIIYTLENNPVISIFWKDDNAKYTGVETVLTDAETDASNNHGSHIQVGSYFLYEQFDSQEVGNDGIFTNACNYFVRVEEPSVNPLNLTETEFGTIPVKE